MDLLSYDKQHCAVSPRVTALETVTRESVRYWKEHFSLEFSSVLGKGMTGIVLQLRCNASSDGASLDRGVYAAKISHPDFSSQVQQEINNYELLQDVVDTKKCFATLLCSQSTERCGFMCVQFRFTPAFLIVLSLVSYHNFDSASWPTLG